MTNFTRFLSDPQFTPFTEVAVSAEKIYPIDPAACVLNCRRSMEFAVKWMYSVDGGLVMPYDNRLVSLMDAEDFRDIVGEDLWRRLKYIRQAGNAAAHTGKKITPEQARLCLENLYIFLDFIAYCYGTDYAEGQFDPALLEAKPEAAPAPQPAPQEVDLSALMEENRALKAELTARREEQRESYVPKPLDLSEYETRKLYIDAMLTDAGWTEGKDWLSEVELPGMPNKSEVGYADYVLYNDTHRPLAVIEAKKTCVDPAKGRQQAKLYADLLEQKYGRRPVIFLTNGFDTRIDDGAYPERKVAAFYSKRDLEKLFNLRSMRTSLKYIQVDKQIAGRYYQEGAIKAVCQAFGERNRRKALLVMATGSGNMEQIRLAFGSKDPNPAIHTLTELGMARVETSAQRGIGDKTEKLAVLAIPAEDAMAMVTPRRKSAPLRYSVTELLCTLGSASAKELCYFTGAANATLRSLEKSGILRLEHREVFRRVTVEAGERAAPPVLNAEQQAAFEGLDALAAAERPAAALLYGVTGSGKTQVYLRLIYEALARGRTAMVLVPEIALTPQLLRIFASHFGDDIAVLHSSLRAGERYDEWKRVRSGQARVVIGTRSAVFAPCGIWGC